MRNRRNACFSASFPRGRMPKLGLPLAVILAGTVQAADFTGGISAGDVTDSSAIVWTRTAAPATLRLEVSHDAFATIDQSLDTATDQGSGHTTRVDVHGLQPSTAYVYRFVDADDPATSSPVGRFRTAPPPDVPAPLRFVFSGDANYAFAPYVLMGHAAREDADFMLFFGDLIYSDVTAGGLGPAITLDDYRAKYEQLHSDPFVRELLVSTPLWVGWDDHEVTNDYAGTDPLLSTAQRDAAYQAFFENQPIRPQNLVEDPYRTYRSFRWGSQVEVFMLDERQYREVSAFDACGGNPDPLGTLLAPFTTDPACRDLLSQPRDMLGAAQLAWLKDGLLNSTAAVRIVVNNVPVSFIGIYPYDRWDGYDAQRRELLEFIDANRIENVIVLTTDIHSNAHNPDVTAYFRRYRPDYALSNRIVVQEFIAGPVGNATLKQELLGVAEITAGGLNMPVLTLAAPLLERILVARLRRLNRLEFIDEDRVAYALVEVDETGRVDVTCKGIDSAEAQNPAAELKTLYRSGQAGSALPVPCFLPLMVLAATACGLRMSRGRRRHRHRAGVV